MDQTERDQVINMKANKKLVFAIFVFIYWIMPDLAPGPLDDILVPILIAALNNRITSSNNDYNS